MVYARPFGWAWYPKLLQPQVLLLTAGLWPLVLAAAGVYGYGRPRDLGVELRQVFVAIGLSALTLATAILLIPLSAPGLLLAIFVALDAALLLGVRLALAVYRGRPGSLGDALARPGPAWRAGAAGLSVHWMLGWRFSYWCWLGQLWP